jgi:succinate dehydrogenase / fumarate reductase cytochrome b subunit
MSVTGAILLAFVIVHMLGNLQIFLGQKALNDYAQHLQELPCLLWPARIILLITLILHLWLAFQLTLENRAARPKNYLQKRAVQATIASKTMMPTGLVILAFIVYHLLHFTLGKTNPEFYHLTDSLGRHDVYSMVVHSFQVPVISISYVVAMFFLCIHLSHGFSSFPQSLGFDTRKCDGIKTAARVVSLLIFIGNCSIPAAILMGWITLPPGA